jgi:glyoxylase-like metal-dependent hydrolase (beta-lactamase superfamily II)
MMRKLVCVMAALGLVATGGVLLSGGLPAVSADRDEDRDDLRPPQTLPQGFESTDRLERDVERAADAPLYSAWLVESSRFVNVPPGSFMPDRAFIPGSTDPRHNIPFFDFPANYGVIKGPDGQITLYDSGWKQLAYIFDWNTSCCWWDARAQMRNIGLDPDKVTRIVLGHGHWDHAGQLDSFPNAVVYIQKEELKQIDFFLMYPTEFNGGHIRAVNTVDPITGLQVGPPAQACARSPVCGYPPQTVAEIQGKILAGKAHVIDGRDEIAPGLVIHPAFRGHTYGSQLLQVHTARGELVFGSDTYSSWEGIRDWNVANIQQTDTIQQFLAYEKCYVLTSNTPFSFNNCLAAHERLSYSSDYPITQNWWTITDGNCSRAAELVLAPGQPSLVPPDVTTGTTRITTPALGGNVGPWRIDSVVCKNTISAVPPHTISP